MEQNSKFLEEVKKDKVCVFADWNLGNINNINIFQNYYVKNDVFTKVELDNLQHLIDSLNPLLKDATIHDTNTNKTNTSYRRSKVLWIPKNKHTLWIYSKLGELTCEVNKAMGWDFDISCMTECIQYTEYDAEYEGFYDWHLDIGNNTTSKRKISISIQLSSSDDYEGGELKFKIGRTTDIASKEKNCAIFFPSYFLHKVEPVTKGKRKSLVLWISGPKLR